MARRRTVTCYCCGRVKARDTDGGLPRGWVPAVISTGPVAQQVVTVCDRCPLPAGTLNAQPSDRDPYVHI